MFSYNGTCTRVIDGDTIEVNVDLGFRINHIVRIRLVDVNAPEIFSGTDKERGLQAKQYLQSIVEGKQVLIHTFKDKMSFNRYIGMVDIIDTKENINILMREFCSKMLP